MTVINLNSTLIKGVGNEKHKSYRICVYRYVDSH